MDHGEFNAQTQGGLCFREALGASSGWRELKRR